jgi:hypothetical protein
MLKQIAILTLVLLARSTFAAEIQPTRSLFGIEAIKVQLNAGLDNSGRGEGVVGQAQYTSAKFVPPANSYFAGSNTNSLHLVADHELPGGAGNAAELPAARPDEIPPDTPYPIHPPVWRKATEIYFNSGPPRQPIGVGYLSTCWSAGGACVNVGPPPQTWHVVDLTNCTARAPWCLPSDAGFAFVTRSWCRPVETDRKVLDSGLCSDGPAIPMSPATVITIRGKPFLMRTARH